MIVSGQNPVPAADAPNVMLALPILLLAAPRSALFEPLRRDAHQSLAHAIVDVDIDAPQVKYDRMIFGGFLEHFNDQVYGGVYDPGNPLADKAGFRRDVLNALKELRTPVVRWPGGCFASGYHWERGVGKNWAPVDDMAWGVREPNAFGTGEYIELCRRLGWTPYICANAGDGTVEEMRDWVVYCNATSGTQARRRQTNGARNPLDVPICRVGNENYHTVEIGYKPIELWAPFVREAARAMKAADPKIRLTAAAEANREWTPPLLKRLGRT